MSISDDGCESPLYIQVRRRCCDDTETKEILMVRTKA